MGIRYAKVYGNELFVYGDDGHVTVCPAAQDGHWIGKPSAKTIKPPNGDDATTDSGDGTAMVTEKMIRASILAIGEYPKYTVTHGDLKAIAESFNTAIANAGDGLVKTKYQTACMVGQSSEETGGFSLLTERGGPFRYDPYRGRGYIQVTWKDNYQAFGAFLKKHGQISDANRFVSNYKEVATMKWAGYTTVWEFTQPIWKAGGRGPRLLDYCADEAGWIKIGRAINSGRINASFKAYGEAKRLAATRAALKVAPDPVSSTSKMYPMKKGTYTLTAHWGQRGPMWSRWHTGQDFAAPTGTPVYAVAAGTIMPPHSTAYAGPNMVVLKLANGETFAYWHLSAKYVKTGQKVRAGQKVGAVGAMGNVTGPHLHFEYYPRGVDYHRIYESKDPMGWLKGARKW